MNSLEHPAADDNHHSHHHQDTCQADRSYCATYPQPAYQPEGDSGQWGMALIATGCLLLYIFRK